MRPTTTYDRGDLVLVPFQFTDRPVAKNRPALIISSAAYHAGRREVIIAAITSRIRQPLLVGDHLIERWSQCGLPKPSVATVILRTVKATMITRKLGPMAAEEMLAVDARLVEALGL